MAPLTIVDYVIVHELCHLVYPDHSDKFWQKVQTILQELKETKKKSINTTDPECTRISGIQGSHAGYSLHGTVDGKNGLLINSDVAGEANDLNQLARQVNQANETLEKKCDTACADSHLCQH